MKSDQRLKLVSKYQLICNSMVTYFTTAAFFALHLLNTALIGQVGRAKRTYNFRAGDCERCHRLNFVIDWVPLGPVQIE